MRLAKFLLDGVDAEAVAPHVVARPQRVLDVQRVEPVARGTEGKNVWSFGFCDYKVEGIPKALAKLETTALVDARQLVEARHDGVREPHQKLHQQALLWVESVKIPSRLWAPADAFSGGHRKLAKGAVCAEAA